MRITKEIEFFVQSWWRERSSRDYERRQDCGWGPNVMEMLRERDPVVTLRECFLQDLNLRGANLHALDLSKTVWKNVDVAQIDLSDANLTRAKFQNIKNLNKAGLTKAKLCHVDLRNMNLSGIKFNSTDITGANCSGVNFTGAIFLDVDFSKVRSLAGADFTNATFDKKSLESIFYAIQRNQIKYHNINVRPAFDYGKPLEKRRLLEKLLPLAKKKIISLQNIDMQEVNLEGLDLSHLCLDQINFSGASLDKADLSYSSLHRAIMTNVTFWQTKLRQVNWANCDVRNANFSQAIGLTGPQITSALNVTRCHGLSSSASEYVEKNTIPTCGTLIPFLTGSLAKKSRKRKREDEENDPYLPTLNY